MLKQLAAGGFKDITRIASSSPVMWEQICENNSSNIRTLLTSMIHDLQEVIDQLDNKNGTYVNEYFKEAENIEILYPTIPLVCLIKCINFMYIFQTSQVRSLRLLLCLLSTASA